MAIDTSMYGGLLQKPKSIAEYDADRLQLQQAQQQNRLADLVYGEKQREIGGDNALASLLAGGKSGADVSQGLAAAGYGNKSMAYTKALQEQKERDAKISGENATAEEKRLKAAQMRIDTAGQTFKFVKDSPTAENAYAAIDHLARNGIYTEEQAAAHKAVIAADPSPGKISQLADMAFRAALSAKDQLSKIETRNLGGTTDTLTIDPVSGKVTLVNSAKNTQSPDSVASVAATIRGQNLTDKRAKEQLQQGKVPSGYRANADGSLSFIPGGPADPNAAGGGKMTEDQGKATGWLIQAENAYKNMMKVGRDKDGNPTSAAKPGFNDALAAIPSFGATTGLANAMRGADRQKFIQATSSLSEALLRAATGAGVNKDEAAQKVQELTPQFGEDPAVTKQKYDAIPLYIESLKVRAGPGAKKAAGVLDGSGNNSSDIDALLKKYGQ